MLTPGGPMTSRPTMLGDLRPPATQAARPARGDDPPEPPANRPTMPGHLPPPATQAARPARGVVPPEPPASRPTTPGDLRPPTPQAARGHESPDPHDPCTGPARSPRPGPAPQQPTMFGDVQPPASEEQGCPCGPGGRRPLPDPVAVRLCRIPDPAPPYDTEVSHGTRPKLLGSSTPADQSRPGPSAEPPVPAPDAFPGWPSRFAQVLAETLAGSRPPGQMVPWTTEMARL